MIELLVDANDILKEFQMDKPIKVLTDTPFENFDPFLPDVPSGTQSNQWTAEEPGKNENEMRKWLTTVVVPKGTQVEFDGKRYEIVETKDLRSTGLTNYIRYRAIFVASQQDKPTNLGKWD